MVKLNFYRTVIENGEEKNVLVFSEEYSYAKGGIVDFYLNKKYNFCLSNRSGTIIDYFTPLETPIIVPPGLPPGYGNRVTVKFDGANTENFTKECNLSEIYHEINNIPIPH